MVRVELALSAALAATAAWAFLYVALRLARRSVSPDHRHATRAFAAWWVGVALYALLVGGLLNALAAFGVVDVRLFTAVNHVAFPLLYASGGALTYYFVYLFTGSRRPLAWVAGAYLLAYGVIVYLMAGRRVVGVEVGPWTTRLVYEPALDGAPFVAILALLALPQVVGALAYLLFALRVPDGGTRYRATLVAGGIILWFTSTFLADAGGHDDLRFLTRPILGLCAALGVMLAYEPPEWVARRLAGDPPPVAR